MRVRLDLGVLFCVLTVVVGTGSYITAYQASGRQTQNAIDARAAQIAAERLSKPEARDSATPIEQGNPALILDSKGNAVPAVSGTIIVHRPTGVTSVAHSENGGQAVHKFIRVGIAQKKEN